VGVTAPPVLRALKSVQGPGGATTNLLPGDVVTYSITLDNGLDGLAAGVVMTDPLPVGVHFGGWVGQGSAQLPPPGTGTLARDIVRWGPHDVPAGVSFSVAFTATVAPGTAFVGSEVANTVWFSSTDAGSGSHSAVFTLKFMDIFLPLVTKKWP